MPPSNTPSETPRSPFPSDVSNEQEKSSWETVTDDSDEWTGIRDYLSKHYPFAIGGVTEDLYSIGFGYGGYRAIHLGEVFKERYKVIHKLGFGDTCTVWLCRDLQKGVWVALRVVIARLSVADPYKIIKDALQGVQERDIRAAHIILPTDEFFVDGYEEDRHYCAVFPFLGPPLECVRSILDGAPDLDQRLLRFCHKAVEAMCFLHKHGICHGDFRPENIQVKLKGVDDMDEKDIMSILGEPERHYRDHYFGRPLGSEWPEYTVGEAYFSRIDYHKFIGDEIGIVGLEDSFLESDPPRELRTPAQFSAPEVLFIGVPGFASDVWALACTIWTIRTDAHPFLTTTDWESIQYAIWNFEYFLGPLPDHYKTAWEKCESALERRWLPLRSPSKRPATKMGFGADNGRHYKPNPLRYIPSSQETHSLSREDRIEMEYGHLSNEDRQKLNEERDRDAAPRYRIHKTLRSSYYDDEYGPWVRGPSYDRMKSPDRRTQPYCTSGFSERVIKFETPFERELAKDWKHKLRDPTPYDPEYDPETPNWVDKIWHIPDDEIPQLADLVSKAWKYDPAERADASSFLEHPWFKPILEKTKEKKLVAKTEETEESWKNRLRPRKKRKAE